MSSLVPRKVGMVIEGKLKETRDQELALWDVEDSRFELQLQKIKKKKYTHMATGIAENKEQRTKVGMVPRKVGLHSRPNLFSLFEKFEL